MLSAKRSEPVNIKNLGILIKVTNYQKEMGHLKSRRPKAVVGADAPDRRRQLARWENESGVSITPTFFPHPQGKKKFFLDTF